MALEPITRQEQIIAGKDLEPITRMEKFLKKYGGGGGASSWNDLKDKPFGEVYGDTITWQIDYGNLNGVLAGDFLLKVSNAIVTMADLTNGLTIATDALGQMEITAQDITNFNNGVLIGPEFLFAFVEENGVGVDNQGLVFPESGVYVVLDLQNGSITIPNYKDFAELKKLDDMYLPEKYLPESKFAQPDWNETDEAKPGYIKNKPNLDKKLGHVRENGIQYLTDGDTKLTAQMLSKILEDYSINFIRIGSSPVFAFGGVSGASVLVTFTLINASDGLTCVPDYYYTSEYTG